MNAGTILSSLVDGLLIGVVYGIAAMGLNLIWGVMRVINLAHGALISLGMFGVYLLFSGLGLNPYLSLLLVAILGLLMGILIYIIGIARVINAPYLSTLLATFAVNMIIIGLGTAAFTTTPRDTGFSLGSFQLGPLTLQGTRLVAALVTLLVTAALYAFLYRTRTGKNIRAVSNNRAAAELMGIPSVPNSGAELWNRDHVGSHCRWTDRHVLFIYDSFRRYLPTEKFCHWRFRRVGQSAWCVGGRIDPWCFGRAAATGDAKYLGASD